MAMGNNPLSVVDPTGGTGGTGEQAVFCPECEEESTDPPSQTGTGGGSSSYIEPSSGNDWGGTGTMNPTLFDYWNRLSETDRRDFDSEKLLNGEYRHSSGEGSTNDFMQVMISENISNTIASENESINDVGVFCANNCDKVTSFGHSKGYSIKFKSANHLIAILVFPLNQKVVFDQLVQELVYQRFKITISKK
jgi:hypothetical protein